MSAAPRVRYLVCTTPRSGSTYLCHVLSRTGRLGMQPYEPRRFEYWKRHVESGFAGIDWRTASVDSLLEDAWQASATPNGVAGFKLMASQLDLVVRTALRRGAGGRTREEVERRLAATTRFLWLRRRDELRQAISWNRALQTDGWYYLAEQQFEGPLVYDFPGIALARRRVRRSDEGWRRFFARTRVEPLTLHYEDYLGDVPGAVSRIAEFLGVELAGPVDVSAGTLRRQSDRTNVEWSARFERDASTPWRAAGALLRALASREWRDSYRRRSRARQTLSGR